jgi:two-component system response regulator FixJ
VLDALRLYLERNGIVTSCFASADAFLAVGDAVRTFDCAVADVRMPGMSGIDLVRHFGANGIRVPAILITGHGEIEMAVGAVKLGAFDFIEKPFDERRLLESIRSAVGRARQEQDEAGALAELRTRFAGLTERQRQVMELAVNGLTNKEIALRLRISPKTVEIHRAWMMERMRASNLAELVRMDARLRTASGHALP